MMNVRKAAAPSVMVPSPADDRPAWIKVGIIATLGFAFGVAWPRLAGIRLGPMSPPTDSTATAAPAQKDAPVSSSVAAAPAAPAASTASAASAAAPPVASADTSASRDVPTVTVGQGVVLSCKTEEGEPKKGFTACGAVPGFDGIARPRLRKLAGCPAAAGATGKLTAIFNIDFPSNRVSVDLGKSSTVPNLDGLAACVKPAFQGVSLGALDHQNPRYSLLYNVTFGPKDATASASAAGTPAASTTAARTGSASSSPSGAAPEADDGTAQVVWEVAIVRDNPRTGQVLARLQRGTKIRLGAGQDGWYRIKYGTDYSSEGWVYRGAIGR